MKYNIQFDGEEALTIEDQERETPILVGDSIMIKESLYQMGAVIHNFEDGKAWVLVK